MYIAGCFSAIITLKQYTSEKKSKLTMCIIPSYITGEQVSLMIAYSLF